MVVGGFAEVRGLTVSVVESDDDGRSVDGGEDEETDERTFGGISLLWGTDSARDTTSATPSTPSRSAKSPPLELRRGVSDGSELWEWFQAYIEGTEGTKNVRVFLLDSTGAAVRGWECIRARPIRWNGPTLDAIESGVAMESFELAHEGIEELEI